MTEALGPHNYWTTTRGSLHLDAVMHALAARARKPVLLGPESPYLRRVSFGANLRRDQFAALMVAERDAALRDQVPAEVVRWPDVEDREHPAIELIARDRRGLVAVEHTIIESYPAQIAEQQALQEMFSWGGPEIAELPHAAQYRLLVHVDDLLAIPRRDRRLAEPTVAKWVRDVLPEVPWPHIPGRPTFVRSRIDNPSIELSLQRWVADIGFIGPLARVIPISFWRPADLEERRSTRLEVAVRAKVPKLLAAATDARTILVLEDRDMYMSAPAFVSRALARIQGADLPDVIYLLNVTAGDPLLTPIYTSGQWWHERNHPLLTFESEWAREFNGLPR